MIRTLLAALALAAPAVHAQSLFVRPATPGLTNAAAPDPAAHLYGMSLFAVQPPQPQTFKIHDLITIIINENSRQSADQKLDADKESRVSAQYNAAIDPLKLLELQLAAGATTNLRLLDAQASREFSGDGKYQRNDRFTDRVTAEIIDVKPNGVLVLEAKRIIQMDEEIKTVIVTGNCRSEDVTKEGTVQSNQLANLTLVVNHEGEVNKAARKGWLTKALDAILPF